MEKVWDNCGCLIHSFSVSAYINTKFFLELDEFQQRQKHPVLGKFNLGTNSVPKVIVIESRERRWDFM